MLGTATICSMLLELGRTPRLRLLIAELAASYPSQQRGSDHSGSSLAEVSLLCLDHNSVGPAQNCATRSLCLAQEIRGPIASIWRHKLQIPSEALYCDYLLERATRPVAAAWLVRIARAMVVLFGVMKTEISKGMTVDIAVQAQV